MNVYKGPYLEIKFEEENQRFINYWKSTPNNIEEFKSELLVYLSCLEKFNPIQIIWLQQNFKHQIDDETKIWVEINILRPRFEKGYIKIDKEGYHPIAFVVGQDVLSHMEVMGVFDEPNPSVFKPKHFATEQEARDWLNHKLIDLKAEPKNKTSTEIAYKGLDEDGNAIIEIKKSATDIANTIKSFKRALEENDFIKSNVEKYASLTKREKEVLKLLSKGGKQKEIAEELFISTHTLREHWKKIKQKLDVQNTNELIKYSIAFQSK
ncbi:helix-turn-helix transcriptional regulator [Polaribacter ponticola]|uniref:LuxR C-terminal-related transcriptional regulator n=1 Tax=Polaribacter ponticola TaxID=2978475 RepID=A0ABT5SAF4_9FLAO|nr:LuxR C-terminal-related transcriptional regulator [Polaribacter sp. MSW5]MDD7915065.1 LuxR C-terminal-related transcriptional regulator [Polaribacter sp. MSW5]